MTAYEKWVSEQTTTNYRFDPNNYATDANGARFTPGMSQPVTTRVNLADALRNTVSRVVTTVSSRTSTGASRSDQAGGGSNKMNFYGAPADINAGRGILGDIGNFIDTSGWSVSQMQNIPAGSFILGGKKAGGGVSVNPAGTTRIAGYDLAGTAGAILQFATGGLFKPQTQQVTPAQQGQVQLPSSMGSTSVISPSTNPAQAIQQASAQPQIGLNGTTTSVLSGLTFDNMIGVFVGIAFISTILGIFKKG